MVDQKNEVPTWSEVLNEKDVPGELRRAIRVMLEPDSIDPLTFFVHMEVVQVRERRLMYEDEDVMTPTFLEYSKHEWGKGRAFPEWFCCAYPGVAKWASHPDSKLDERLDIAFPHDANENGHLKMSLLRKVVDIYKDVVSEELECASSNSLYDKSRRDIDVSQNDYSDIETDTGDDSQDVKNKTSFAKKAFGGIVAVFSLWIVVYSFSFVFDQVGRNTGAAVFLLVVNLIFWGLLARWGVRTAFSN